MVPVPLHQPLHGVPIRDAGQLLVVDEHTETRISHLLHRDMVQEGFLYPLLRHDDHGNPRISAAPAVGPLRASSPESHLSQRSEQLLLEVRSRLIIRRSSGSREPCVPPNRALDCSRIDSIRFVPSSDHHTSRVFDNHPFTVRRYLIPRMLCSDESSHVFDRLGSSPFSPRGHT
ncbi:hypothetical protein VUR80DRAFT_1616 [Thermomyces stellatus]